MRELRRGFGQPPLPRTTSAIVRVLFVLVPVFIVIVGLTPGTSEGSTPTPAWSLLTPSSPPGPIVGAALAYDRTDRTVVLWGGGTAAGSLTGNTWGFNGSAWRALPPGPVRIRSNLVYDRQIHELLAFGGDSETGVTGDTWTFDGAAWTQIATSGPPAREGAVMAYDPKIKEVVLFGGDNGVSPPYFSDTWAWTPVHGWVELSPGQAPSPRFGATISYDRALGKLVLFGGESNLGVQSDTWTFDGSTWQPLPTSPSPPARVQQAMTYDNHLQALVLWGGVGVGDLGDTWLLRGSQWIELSTGSSGPTAAQGQEASLAYYPPSRMAVLVGGGDSAGQVSGQEWGLR